MMKMVEVRFTCEQGLVFISGQNFLQLVHLIGAQSTLSSVIQGAKGCEGEQQNGKALDASRTSVRFKNKPPAILAG